MSLRRFGSLRINKLRKFVSATTQFYFTFRTHLHRPRPRAEMPPAKAKARTPVTSIRSEQLEDDDLPPLEPEEEETDRLHPSPPTGVPGSDSSDELAPVPDDYTGFPPKKEDMQEDQQEKGEEENRSKMINQLKKIFSSRKAKSHSESSRVSPCPAKRHQDHVPYMRTR